MVIVNGKIVSSRLFSETFSCAIEHCRGACCIEGDSGAPLDPEERQTLEGLLPIIWPRIPEEGQNAIREQGVSRWYEEAEEYGTPLREEDQACAFVRIDEKGIAQCTIEEAWQAGEIPFRKPISCHLYPIRIESNEEKSFEALNYEEWDICHAACSAGEQRGIRVYEFAREALIRKYGLEFYRALEAADPQSEKTNTTVFE